MATVRSPAAFGCAKRKYAGARSKRSLQSIPLSRNRIRRQDIMVCRRAFCPKSRLRDFIFCAGGQQHPLQLPGGDAERMTLALDDADRTRRQRLVQFNRAYTI